MCQSVKTSVRERDRETERQRDREIERQRETERETERQRERERKSAHARVRRSQNSKCVTDGLTHGPIQQHATKKNFDAASIHDMQSFKEYDQSFCETSKTKIKLKLILSKELILVTYKLI